MEIDKDLELADEWAKNVSPWVTDSLRATCKRLADEVRRLRKVAEEQRCSAEIRGANVETLRAELRDITAALDDARINNTMTAAEVVNEDQALMRQALEALECSGEPDDPGHRCSHCDDYVDRNGLLRAALRERLGEKVRQALNDGEESD